MTYKKKRLREVLGLRLIDGLPADVTIDGFAIACAEFDLGPKIEFVSRRVRRHESVPRVWSPSSETPSIPGLKENRLCAKMCR